MYAAAREAGALGGKLTGAGGGGFFLVFAPPRRRRAIRERLRRLLCVPFNFEFSGSQIVFFTPEPDYSRAERDRLTHPIAPFRELGEDKAPPPARSRARS
jgi:D-glycero-alpha-D-manno-heptose-7-phosphate kinase